MGASIFAVWPSMTKEDYENQPGFCNDCKAWGDWMAEREGSRKVLKDVRQLGVEALLTVKTDGMKDRHIQWVSPKALRDAALQLRALVQAGDPRTQRILDSYALGANHDDPVAEEFAVDLEDVAEIAEFAAERGATTMTLEVNW